jgi:uncharacterized membrane protein
MKKPRDLWTDLRSSFWFVPAVIVCAAVTLALALIETDRTLTQNAGDTWPRLFGAGAAGSRGMLSSIAGSMITGAGVIFSITIVSLSLASSQYSSRVLRNFMRDRTNQTVLGASQIIATVAKETLEAVNHLFPENRGDPADEAEGAASMAQRPFQGAIPARRTVYVQRVDVGALMDFARARQTIVRMGVPRR